MTDPLASFKRLRSRLEGIAYRMLGSTADAEEVVQDAWLRWHEADMARVANAEAWLVSVTTRIAIDRLRSTKVARAHGAGRWPPETLRSDSPESPEALLERADEVSVAFTKLLERLAPPARAAYLLREVFDIDYREVAEALGKSEPTCRQLVHRARTQLRDDRPRHAVARETQRRLLRGFADAAVRGEFAGLKRLLVDDARRTDSGGAPRQAAGGRAAPRAAVPRRGLAAPHRRHAGRTLDAADPRPSPPRAAGARRTGGEPRVEGRRHKTKGWHVLTRCTSLTTQGNVMNQPRLPWNKIVPKTYQSMAATSASFADSSLGALLIELVQVRVSQINGCAYCLDTHVRDLRKQGETWQRINSLSTWREAGLYNARERAALAWVESLTHLSPRPAQRDADFEALKAHFSDQEIVELSWAIATINTWNRMAIGMQAPVSDKPLE